TASVTILGRCLPDTVSALTREESSVGESGDSRGSDGGSGERSPAAEEEEACAPRTWAICAGRLSSSVAAFLPVAFWTFSICSATLARAGALAPKVASFCLRPSRSESPRATWAPAKRRRSVSRSSRESVSLGIVVVPSHPEPEVPVPREERQRLSEDGA